MGKKLAIKGHSTRGKEVIELLEMMGGVNWMGSLGNTVNRIYYISESKSISFDDISLKLIDEYEIFTLEEFWEKYPIKIDDEVTDLKTDKIAEVYKMHWSENNSCIYYDIKYPNNCGCQRRLMDLQPYEKEIDMKESTTLNMSAIDYNNGLVGYEIPEGYEFDTVIDNKVVLKKLKPTYPKTYNGCYDILNCFNFTDVEQYNFENDWRLTIKDKNYGNLMNTFVKLLICRDTYWKIAGEQMGLDKPWEPRWNDNYQKKWIINFYQDEINLTNGPNVHFVLTFPSEEMRDAFYENFKDLIEQCKELL